MKVNLFENFSMCEEFENTVKKILFDEFSVVLKETRTKTVRSWYLIRINAK